MEEFITCTLRGLRYESSRQSIVLVLLSFCSFFSLATAYPVFALPTQCKFGGQEGYFTGINYMDIKIARSVSVYPPNIDCKLHLVTSASYSKIKLHWVMMDMEPRDASGVCRDWVQLYDKERETGAFKPLTSRLCGNEKMNDVMYIESKDLLLEVKTSAIQTTHKGFELEYGKYASVYETPAAQTDDGLNSGQIAAIAIGVSLLLLLLFLLILCLFCCCNHKDDVLLWRRYKKADTEPMPIETQIDYNNQARRNAAGAPFAQQMGQNRFFLGHLYRPQVENM